MFRVIQVCVRARLLTSRRLPAAAVPCRGPGLSRQLRSGDRSRVRSCTVDPRLEEQFEFLDCGESEEDTHQEVTTLLHQPNRPCFQALPPEPHQASLHLRSLQEQLQVLGAQNNPEMESLIQFQDVDFPLTAEKKKKKKKKSVGKGEHRVFGTPDEDEPFSDTSCSGCGALLHCTTPHVPGFLPSEKFKALRQDGDLSGATCQRCHLLTHYHKAIKLEMCREQYKAALHAIRTQRALVLLVVDLLDLPDSIVTDLPELVGADKRVVVLGNKADLLPADSPDYLRRIKQRLVDYCTDAGFRDQVADVHLISAKTGYGVEKLISSLQRSWKYRGDVYLVGSANAGKSTLFNVLLESDFCKSTASERIHRATISPWPGTTLNLLKFPIINPTPYRMFRRQQRLNEASRQMESDLSEDELRRLRRFSQQGYLVGRVGRTFRSDVGSRPSEIQFDPDSLAFGGNEDEETTGGVSAHGTTAPSRMTDSFTTNELKDARWLFDTPGILKQNDILNLLNEREVKLVVPTQAVIPRTFVLKPGMSLFVGALYRIDFLQGGKSSWFSVVVSNQLPVHITSLEKADSVYEKHAGHVLLGVPAGGLERMKDFPALVPQEVQLEGRGYLEAAADIKLSSAGWVAVTAGESDQVLLRVHSPETAGCALRTPPLLPHIVSLKGDRIRKSPTYKLMKPAGQLDKGLQVKKTMKKTK